MFIPFAKGLWANSDGIHEKAKDRTRGKNEICGTGVEWLATRREAFACEVERDVISWEGIQGNRTVPFLLLGIVAIGWAGFSLISGRGYYKGCPPGGYDRGEHPFYFWVPTMILLGIGVCMILIFLGVIPLPSR